MRGLGLLGDFRGTGAALVLTLAMSTGTTLAMVSAATFGASLTATFTTLGSSCVFWTFTQFLRYLVLLNFLAKEAFNLQEGGLVLLTDQRKGCTFAAGTGSTTDTVDVVLGIMGDVKVDDKLDVVDINASRDDIGGYEDVDLLALEAVHGLVALLLGEVAVHGFHVVALALEGYGDILHLDLGAAEDDDALGGMLGEVVLEYAELLGLVADVGGLVDTVGGSADGYLDLHGVVEDVLGQLDDLLGHGG